jgi:hypothetical protein
MSSKSNFWRLLDTGGTNYGEGGRGPPTPLGEGGSLLPGGGTHPPPWGGGSLLPGRTHPTPQGGGGGGGYRWTGGLTLALSWSPVQS